MSIIRRSLIISLAERYFMIALQLASFIILARLLTPEEIGLFSVSAALIGLAQVVRDFGVGSYLIQEKEITDTRIATAFTITLSLALLLFTLTQLLAAPIASFYNDGRLEGVLRLLSINFLIIPFNSTTLALIRRSMKFGVLFWINISAASIGTAAALILAYLDFGYMSLVWSSIANAATICIGGMIYKRKELWIKPTFKEWRRVASFGSQASAAGIVTEIAMSINDLVIGKVMGFSAVAIISRAQGVMNLFQREVMGAIRNVAFPAFAQAHRENKDLETIHTRAINAITAIAWPFYCFLAIFPLETLRVLFGPQWDAAAPLVPIFCLAGAIAATWNLNLPMLIAMGRVDMAMRAEINVQLMRIALLVICAMTFKTVMPYAVAFLIAYIYAAVIFYYYKHQVLKNNWQHKALGLITSLKLTLISLSFPIIIKISLIEEIIYLNEFLTLLISATFTISFWVLGLKRLQHPLISDPLFPNKLHKFFSK